MLDLIYKMDNVKSLNFIIQYVSVVSFSEWNNAIVRGREYAQSKNIGKSVLIEYVTE